MFENTFYMMVQQRRGGSGSILDFSQKKRKKCVRLSALALSKCLWLVAPGQLVSTEDKTIITGQKYSFSLKVDSEPMLIISLFGQHRGICIGL